MGLLSTLWHLSTWHDTARSLAVVIWCAACLLLGVIVRLSRRRR